MDSSTIRRSFLNFFEERKHKVVPSSPVVGDDPTLLFTTAGMVQFKPYFEGTKRPPFDPPRATSVQKCLRTPDLELVGTNTRSLTFFEMLGNFAFGDYFKEEAILWAWELVTRVFGMDPDRIYPTIHATDEEAHRIWETEVGVPPARIIPQEKNFWDMGVAGPCGPQSELLYDRGDDFGAAYREGGEIDEERYLEIWNLVFMQNLRDDAGNIVGDLPEKNIDTGAGLERNAAVLQDVPTTLDIDTMKALRGAAESISNQPYGHDPHVDVSLRVMAEHARAVTFALADGVMPSNLSRGYVVRKLMRRAVRYARKIGIEQPFLTGLCEVAIEWFGGDYPELRRNADLIRRVVDREEARFDITLRHGLGVLEEQVAAAKSSGATALPGTVAFRLHDTYGFPLDLTEEIAGEEGLGVNTEEFEREMQLQRRRARAARGEAASQASLEAGPPVPPTEFVGYSSLAASANVTTVFHGGGAGEAAREGEEAQLVLDSTTFYAESGGQVGDRGEIRTAGGVFEVTDTKFAAPGVIVHQGRVISGEIRSGDQAQSQVDPQHREGVEQAHTATHILHWVLRDFLGEHARQQGSLVEPGRLRFDFSHFEAVDSGQIASIEEEINRRVIAGDGVHAFETSYDYAMELGAMALFGEKYADFVRVVEVGDYSRELCGGTHVTQTGEIGVVKLIAEGSVAAGTRRVEAYTGLAGLAHLNEQAMRLNLIAERLKTDPEHTLERLDRTLEALRQMEAELAGIKAVSLENQSREILDSEAVRPAGAHQTVAFRRDGSSVDELRRLASSLLSGLGSGVVAVGGSTAGKANIVVAGSREAVDGGISARDLAKEGADLLGGGGGGRPEMAVAGGADSTRLDEALSRIEARAREELEKL